MRGSCSIIYPHVNGPTTDNTLIESRYWSVPVPVIMHSLEGNLFMLGFGGIVVVTLSSYWGRLPILVYFLVGALVTAAWSAAATNFQSFMTARILNGFFSTVAQAVSPQWLHIRQQQEEDLRTPDCNLRGG